MDFRLLGQHENELIRQVREHARLEGEARPRDGHVGKVTGADWFAVFAANEGVAPQRFARTGSAIDGHALNLRVYPPIIFAKC